MFKTKLPPIFKVAIPELLVKVSLAPLISKLPPILNVLFTLLVTKLIPLAPPPVELTVKLPATSNEPVALNQAVCPVQFHIKLP